MDDRVVMGGSWCDLCWGGYRQIRLFVYHAMNCEGGIYIDGMIP